MIFVLFLQGLDSKICYSERIINKSKHNPSTDSNHGTGAFLAPGQNKSYTEQIQYSSQHSVILIDQFSQYTEHSQITVITEQS
jgi:hypothetical protein